jgi:SSS family transporter
VRTAITIDYVIIAVYMLLMLSIGVYFMHFNKGASDYFKGGNRIPWLVAGISSFMSGFSAFTFTGAAGIAYREGVAAIALYVGNACTFLLGYWIFGVRWRRSRITTTMEYLSERFDQRTRQAFSVTTVFFQLFMGASTLYGLGLFVGSICGLPIEPTILVSGAIILFYCLLGGLWAVVIADFLQAVILMPFCLVLVAVALLKVEGISGLISRLPENLMSLSLPGQMGWIYVASWTVMVSFGYNTSAMAQRYFSVDQEQSARKVALLCFALFLVGSLIWFIPPLAMRVLYPNISTIWPGLANPHEASYALAALALLPNGLIGIMLAAMFSSSMANLSGLFNLHAAIISKDVYQNLFARDAGEKQLLRVGRITTLAVGVTITSLAIALATTGQSIFNVMLAFNTIMSLAYGPPALLGLVVKRTPHWSGLLSFMVALILGCLGSFIYHWSFVTRVMVIVPISIAVFLFSRLFEKSDQSHAAGREALFKRLMTPINVANELRETTDLTKIVFRFLSRVTAVIGLASMTLVLVAPADQRITVIAYSSILLVVAGSMLLIPGLRTLAPGQE